MYVSAINLFKNSINSFNVIDLYNFLNDGKPIFYTNNIDPFSYYYSRPESTDIIIDLLKFQFNDDDEKIKEFLTNIISWLNKKGWYDKVNNEYILNQKINCLVLTGPPNSGKFSFFDIIVAICINVGHIGRIYNKTNNFALQEVVDRRLVVGNEITMEDGAKEDFKNYVRVKS
ncbi:initiator protein NS1 [Trichonephila clavata]|uniref:Initiator protein NS1 n=1 Tax=Trichonephila clavata TaxID=2740835 RepID=A0A8X6FAR4_TRICU|nr:initiator protein NS1 [Trichonephila clavata]